MDIPDAESKVCEISFDEAVLEFPKRPYTTLFDLIKPLEDSVGVIEAAGSSPVTQTKI